MKIMNRFTWQSMWKNKTRTLVTIAGIIVSAAMFTAVVTLGVSLLHYMIRQEIAYSGDYYVEYDLAAKDDLENLKQEEHVTDIGNLKNLGFITVESEHIYPQTYILGAGDDAFYRMISVPLLDGRLPQSSDEILITQHLQKLLENGGVPASIGQSIELQVMPEYTGEDIKSVDWERLESEAKAFTKPYKIVGIIEDGRNTYDITFYLDSILTYADGQEEPFAWQHLFVKTDSPKQAHDLSQRFYGQTSSANTALLNLYGATKYSNVNSIIRSLSTVLMLIIMVGSISLIYNAFSISISERTKQFGLLSSIGATRRQMRRSVFFEALSLCCFGIPLGILFGYLGIAVVLHFFKPIIMDLFGGYSGSQIVLKAIPSVPAFLAAACITLLTVLLSAWIPAKRAGTITPISAIQQRQEYQLPRKTVSLARRSSKLFGLPGTLAKKYYTVNRKKYRATVVSLTISLVLFTAATSFSHALNQVKAQSLESYNFDILIDIYSQEELKKIRSNPAFGDSALLSNDYLSTVVPEDSFTPGYKDIWEHHSNFSYNGRSISEQYASLYYLEDDQFRAYLKEHHIDPAPYFDPESPTALVANTKIISYESDDAADGTNRMVYEAETFQEGAAPLQFYSVLPPEELSRAVAAISPSLIFSYQSSWQDMPVYLYEPNPDLPAAPASNAFIMEDGSLHVVVCREAYNGVTSDCYYLLNPETEERDRTPLLTQPVSKAHQAVRPGAPMEVLPFGVRLFSSLDSFVLVMPLSMADSEVTSLAVRVNDYNSAVSFLDAEGYEYSDYLAEQIRIRNLIIMINTFTFGFIVLISLICICNVFNTISTNISLRQKDFGMLRSIGMKSREIYRMMAFECLQYGMKTLLWGIPISLLVSYGIHLEADLEAFRLPISSILIGAGCIFTVVFVTMFYGVSKLKKSSPIEAIRIEG